MGKINRVFVEKKADYGVEARGLYNDLRNNLGMKAVEDIRIFNRYDVLGLSDSEFARARELVLSEPPVDSVYEEELPALPGYHLFAVELLPGQYDQREDFAEQCIQLITQKERPVVSSAKVYAVKGKLAADDLEKIKNYCVNPVEARLAELPKPEDLLAKGERPKKVQHLAGFVKMNQAKLEELRGKMGLAMSLEDLLWCQKYFRDEEKRNPTVTEIKVLDTYWSDHCRHTTFMTHLDDIAVEESVYTLPIKSALSKYLQAREEVYGKDTKRPVTLMDIACINAKKLKKAGLLPDLDESEEINACSIVAPIQVDGKTEDWLIMFKNETHNHPTEIEPFGGAATCLGGAIRDPLSGRSYVYQAMRITGSADPRLPIAKTLKGKLPQKKITQGAAAGYSSYGNQIGLATGYVHEYYHENFVAKRMEIGAVIGAAPRSAVRRQRPAKGDIVVLLGGRTGRDGCGGATGASKEHNLVSLSSCGAEVQKGNPPTERKIQRLFRNPNVTAMIKRCNDFGAGGVSVAIGELTDGLDINLDLVPKKYEGLDGTELAISESQERMAVVIATKNREKFIAFADEENLEATVVAEVNDTGRLVMTWQGDRIVDLSRKFLDTNGVPQHAKVVINKNIRKSVFNKLPKGVDPHKDLLKAWLKNLQNINVASQKGLCERFDSTIGRGTVQMPFGGRTQLTPSEGMVGRVPVLQGKTVAATVMASGYNPEVPCWSPFHGAMYAVAESVARAVALGADPTKLRLTLQEYFQKLHDETSWGQPFSALLGAFATLDALDLPAIGGKDSMSGTFMDKTVPPTLVSFAVDVVNGDKTVSAEFKKAGSRVVFLPCPRNESEVLDFDVLKQNLVALHKAIGKGQVLAAAVVKDGGIAALVSTMCLGNGLGFNFNKVADLQKLFILQPAGLVLEVKTDPKKIFGKLAFVDLGQTTSEGRITVNNVQISLEQITKSLLTTWDKVFPRVTKEKDYLQGKKTITFKSKLPLTASVNIVKPRVFIPVFPGINCEYDSAAAFRNAGADPQIFVIRNLTAAAIEESVQRIVKEIGKAQIIMIPGGFSAGDEPEGSGKFIATMLRNPRIKEAIEKFLNQKDGLMLGICNGFQALIKLGLVPYGEIRPMTVESPTLTFNNIGRHVSQMVATRIVSNKSPWLADCKVGEEFVIPVSHGEGRFVAPKSTIEELFRNGQVATQYVDAEGNPTMLSPFNPNGSMYAIEGITSPDGRVLGKMGHSERFTEGLFRNIAGEKDQRIFVNGVRYFQ